MPTKIIAVLLPLSLLLVACSGQGGLTLGNPFQPEPGEGCSVPASQRSLKDLTDEWQSAMEAVEATVLADQTVGDPATTRLRQARRGLAAASQADFDCAGARRSASDRDNEISFLALAAEKSRYAGREADEDLVLNAGKAGEAACKNANPVPGSCVQMQVEPNMTVMRGAADVIFDTSVDVNNAVLSGDDTLTTPELIGLVRSVEELAEASDRIDDLRASGALNRNVSGIASDFQVEQWCQAVVAALLMPAEISDGEIDAGAETQQLLIDGEMPSPAVARVLTQAGFSITGLSELYPRYARKMLALDGRPDIDPGKLFAQRDHCRSRP